MKKIILTIFTIIIATVLDFILIFNILSYDKILNKSIDLVNYRAKEIASFLDKYDVQKSGILDVDVNYRGAHGENYPSSYTYFYELSDKLYLENKEYVSIEYDKNIFYVLNKLSKLDEIDFSNCANTKRKNNKLEITCDASYINNIFGTNFKKINATIHTRGIIRELDYVSINLDDIELTLVNDDLIIKYLNNKIKISFNESSYYLNINDLLKANILVNNVYSCSIVIKDKVYYLEVRDNGLYIKFNSQESIYNSISILVKYNYMILDKDKEIKNIKDNPIANYLSNSDFNIWRN